MKLIIIFFAVATFNKCSSKKASDSVVTDKTTTSSTVENKTAGSANVAVDGIPPCINKLIDSFRTEPKQNPPRSIYRYIYNNSTVYYIPAICCDFYSDLIDSNCNVMGHPDGGFTGRGDGKFGDFRTAKTNEKLIWHDERK